MRRLWVYLLSVDRRLALDHTVPPVVGVLPFGQRQLHDLPPLEAAVDKPNGLVGVNLGAEVAFNVSFAPVLFAYLNAGLRYAYDQVFLCELAVNEDVCLNLFERLGPNVLLSGGAVAAVWLQLVAFWFLVVFFLFDFWFDFNLLFDFFRLLLLL